MISLIKLYNFISIYKNLFIISLFIYSSIISTMNGYIELGKNDSNFSPMSKIASENLLYITNHSLFTYFTIMGLLFVFILLLCIAIIFFSKEKKHSIATNEVIKIINSFNLSKKYKIYFHRNKTFSSLGTLYISFKDYINIKDVSSKFKILHEISHIKSYDSVVNLFEKSLQIIFSIIISAVISGKGEELLRQYQFSYFNIIIPLYIIVSFSLIFIVILYINFFPTRFKEYLCDIYAMNELNMQPNLYNPYNQKNKFLIKLQHPDIHRRKQFLLGNNLREKLFLCIYEILCLSLYIYLFINISSNWIIYALLFLILLYISLFLKVIKI